MKVLFLCRSRDVVREALGYSEAFIRSGWSVEYLPDGFPTNGRISDTDADLILHPETAFNVMPKDIAQTNAVTACFHYDCFTYTHKRARWASLFDYTFVFHPGYERMFTNAYLLPHASNRYSGQPGAFLYEVGFVGGLTGLYKTRRTVLPRVAERFRMNSWAAPDYDPVGTYSRCKIGLNIGRDDYPEDANLRVFEIMSAGALLITRLPSELEQLGFQAGKHFVGYSGYVDLMSQITFYLTHEIEREQIAACGAKLVRSEHTYDARVARLTSILGLTGKRATGMKARLAYLDYRIMHSPLRHPRQALTG